MQRFLAILLLIIAFEASAQEKLWVESTNRPVRDQTLKASTYTKLAQAVSPAVVNVVVSYKRPGGIEEIITSSESWRGEDAGLGSGFIIHPSGLFLTNNHVVEGADRVRVKLHDNREIDAEFVGVDPATDIALMRIRGARGLPTVSLANSDLVKVGDQVLAIGNPLGLSHTVTLGIVSALGRRNLNPGGRENFSDFIQTDASINPGNSGGPLVNLNGEVVGINTAINRQGQGIGFAIPINVIKSLVPQLMARGYVERTWLGVRVQEVTPVLARSFGMDQARGALVTEITDVSPASKAGILTGDIILSFDKREIISSDQLPWIVSSIESGKIAETLILRNGKEERVEVTIEGVPNQTPPKLPATRSTTARDTTQLGIEVREIGTNLARQLGSPKAGIVVTEIAEDSRASESGLKVRDVVVEIGAEPVESAQSFEALMSAFSAGDVVRFKVIRGGHVVYVAFER